MDHELDDLARGEVLASFLVVLFVELADEFLEDVAHAEIREAGELATVGTDGVVVGKVDGRRDEFLDDAVERVGLAHLANLVAQVELRDDLGDVRAESVEVVVEVRLELGGIAEEALECEFGRVVEDLAGGFAETVRIEESHVRLVLLEIHLGEHRVLGVLEQAVDSPEDEHGQDDVSVFSPDEDVAQAVVGDRPDEGDDLVVGRMIHGGTTERRGRGARLWTVGYSRDRIRKEERAPTTSGKFPTLTFMGRRTFLAPLRAVNCG